MKAKELPSAEYLNECFFYDHISGILVWKTRPLSHFEDEWRMNQSNSRMSGKSPTVKSDGYVVLKISGVTYKAHRLIWKMVYGEDAEQIDHVNGVRSDNRLLNLRAVTKEENAKNRAISRNNTSGHQGVYWHTKYGKWYSKIVVDNKTINLYWGDSYECAVQARVEAETLYYPELRRK